MIILYDYSDNEFKMIIKGIIFILFPDMYLLCHHNGFLNAKTIYSCLGMYIFYRYMKTEDLYSI